MLDDPAAPAPWIPIGPAVASGVDLPVPSENLFGRVIRNPVPAGRPPRERECTEMLASVVSLAPRVRDAIVSWWLEGDSGWNGSEELRFDIETEGAVLGGKRDDLRIEALTQEDEPVLLVSVEVKVGAGFHQSLAVGDDGELEEHLDHQVTHYDTWLASQPHPMRKGVVLAPTDRSEGLPAGLRAPWTCVTWGELGRVVADLVENEDLSPTERFLARHLVGFIQDHLGEITVDRDELAFDDVALLRAVARLGKDLSTRAENLVSPLKTVFGEVGLGVDEPGHQKNLLTGGMRSVVWRYLYPVDKSPYLMAGIVTERGIDVAVWLESSSKHPAKEEIQEAVTKYLRVLEDADPRWQIPEDSSWWDLEIRFPLEHLLVVEDQEETLRGFVRTALEQLKTCGLLEEIEEIVVHRSA